jgi:hypothetical protein
MLRPFLPGVADMVPPPALFNSTPLTHFGERAGQRGVCCIPGDLLKWAVERALFEGRQDVIEKVWDICPDTSLYRILLPEGAFYPVIRRDNGVAVTIYSQAEKSTSRLGRNLRKKHCGRRTRRSRRQVAQ